MGDQVGTREQHRQRPPARTEYAYLMLAVAAAPTLGLLCAVDHLTAADFSRGVYSGLAAAIVVGGCGWIVRSGDTLRRRELGAGLEELRELLAELTSKVEQNRRPPATKPVSGACRTAGHMYLSQAAIDGDTVPVMQRVDPEALRAEVERVVVEELGTRDAVRAQGYAEGYVDGIGRRDGEPPPD